MSKPLSATAVFDYSPRHMREGVIKIVRHSAVQAAAAPRRSRVTVVLSALGLFFGLSAAAFVYSLSTERVAAGSVASLTAVPASSDVRPLEVHIANNGQVLLRSARVTSINGETISVSTSWGDSGFTWLVRTDARAYETHKFGTHFINSAGGEESLSDIRPGSLVTITGMLDSSAHSPTIDAGSVRSLE